MAAPFCADVYDRLALDIAFCETPMYSISEKYIRLIWQKPR